MLIIIISDMNDKEKLSKTIMLLKYETFVFQSTIEKTSAAVSPTKTNGNRIFLNPKISEKSPIRPIEKSIINEIKSINYLSSDISMCEIEF